MMISYLVLAEKEKEKTRREKNVSIRRASLSNESSSNTELTQVSVLKRVERSPLAVDSHLLAVGQSQSLHLGDVVDGLHVGGVASGSEDDSDLGGGVDVVGGNKSASGVVDEGREGDGDVLRQARRGKQVSSKFDASRK